MKNLLIASAVASALLSPLAVQAAAHGASEAPTIYGNFRYTVASIDAGESNLQAVNNASRIGIKGAIGGNSGLTGFYHMQMGANNDAGGTALSSRFFFAGVKGAFGKVLLGRSSTPYKMAAVSGGFDPFYDTIAGKGNGGSSFGLSGLTNGFTDNSVAYYGKSGSISYNVAAYLDDSTADDHAINFGMKWADKSASFGVQILSDQDGSVVANGGSDALRLHGTYKIDNLSLSASFEDIDYDAGKDGTLVFVGAKWKLDGGNSFEAQLGSNSGDLTSGFEAEGTGWAVGYTSKLAKKTQLRFIASGVDYDAADGTNSNSDRDAFGVMLVQSF